MANLTYMLPPVRSKLEFISVRDGSSRELYSSSNLLGQPVWLRDSRSLIVPMESNSANRATQLWSISYPQGKIQAFTNDLADYGYTIDMARDSNTLATVQNTVVSSVWIAPKRGRSEGPTRYPGRSSDGGGCLVTPRKDTCARAQSG